MTSRLLDRLRHRGRLDRLAWLASPVARRCANRICGRHRRAELLGHDGAPVRWQRELRKLRRRDADWRDCLARRCGCRRGPGEKVSAQTGGRSFMHARRLAAPGIPRPVHVLRPRSALRSLGALAARLGRRAATKVMGRSATATTHPPIAGRPPRSSASSGRRTRSIRTVVRPLTEATLEASLS